MFYILLSLFIFAQCFAADSKESYLDLLPVDIGLQTLKYDHELQEVWDSSVFKDLAVSEQEIYFGPFPNTFCTCWNEGNVRGGVDVTNFKRVVYKYEVNGKILSIESTQSGIQIATSTGKAAIIDSATKYVQVYQLTGNNKDSWHFAFQNKDQFLVTDGDKVYLSDKRTSKTTYYNQIRPEYHKYKGVAAISNNIGLCYTFWDIYHLDWRENKPKKKLKMDSENYTSCVTKVISLDQEYFALANNKGGVSVHDIRKITNEVIGFKTANATIEADPHSPGGFYMCSKNSKENKIKFEHILPRKLSKKLLCEQNNPSKDKTLFFKVDPFLPGRVIYHEGSDGCSVGLAQSNPECDKEFENFRNNFFSKKLSNNCHDYFRVAGLLKKIAKYTTNKEKFSKLEQDACKKLFPALIQKRLENFGILEK